MFGIGMHIQHYCDKLLAFKLKIAFEPVPRLFTMFAHVENFDSHLIMASMTKWTFVDRQPF